MRRPASC